MKIILGADYSGFNLKEAIKKHLQGKGIKVADVGVSDPANDTPYGDKNADRAMLFAIQHGHGDCG